MNATAGYVINADYAGSDRRITEGERRDGNRREIRIHFPTVLYTSLLWMLLTGALAWIIDNTEHDIRSAITIGTAAAPNPVAPGDILTVIHGVTGACLHPDGGMIVAEAKPAAGVEWRLIKRITAGPLNLEPRGALAKWRIPARWSPGVYVGRITVWCYGSRQPQRSEFNFSVRQ